MSALHLAGKLANPEPRTDAAGFPAFSGLADFFPEWRRLVMSAPPGRVMGLSGFR
ncbi:MAG: hypothetical protein IT428_28655 [Planctomycetaceae bacterium]|nr:hypothetical protein [Planctomycetaceae bacterium]